MIRYFIFMINMENYNLSVVMSADSVLRILWKSSGYYINLHRVIFANKYFPLRCKTWVEIEIHKLLKIPVTTPFCLFT